ncbi:MAG: hypothetical protein OEO20_07595 [Gemmatimonadota bacterium]|nr:hypothetical protein [Gemmatimonadota bacterium]MDH3368501.1 hypothetical protein [Gemmatimonadota bacterium]MDH3478153.1 hypothetical protein [Gemmatimonadota bacterium]MDH3570310.1 hypothetical protein [Gemmatimonadota bacterium]MDH5551551.1 hypothetical protein [Gemmatimonadota bacterium]
MRRVLFPCVVMLACPLGSALGQVANLQPGERVRVTAPAYDLRRTPATFRAMRSGSLHLDFTRKRLDHGGVVVDSPAVAVPLAMVSRLEAPAGRRSNWDKGARAGALVGGGVGLLLGVAYAACDDSWVCPQSGGEKIGAVVVGAVAVGFAGGLVGTMIGALSSRDAWRDVPLGRARVAVHPTPDGFALGVAFRF